MEENLSIKEKEREGLVVRLEEEAANFLDLTQKYGELKDKVSKRIGNTR